MSPAASQINRVARRFGVEISRTTPPAATRSARPDGDAIPRDFPTEYTETIRAVEFATMTSAERLGALIEAVQWIETHQVPGAVVECGVWRGGSTMAALLTLKRLGNTSRDIWLYDTFAGMTEPEEVDRHYDGRTAEQTLADMEPDAESMQDWCNASLDDVRRNVTGTGYPTDLVHYVEGPVEETLPGTLPGSIALLRLDTDFYASTQVELEHLYPLVAKNGIVIIDDYGAWQGARRAVDEFLESRPDIYLHRIDVTGRLFVNR